MPLIFAILLKRLSSGRVLDLHRVRDPEIRPGPGERGPAYTSYSVLLCWMMTSDPRVREEVCFHATETSRVRCFRRSTVLRPEVWLFEQLKAGCHGSFFRLDGAAVSFHSSIVTRSAGMWWPSHWRQ